MNFAGKGPRSSTFRNKKATGDSEGERAEHSAFGAKCAGDGA